MEGCGTCGRHLAHSIARCTAHPYPDSNPTLPVVLVSWRGSTGPTPQRGSEVCGPEASRIAQRELKECSLIGLRIFIPYGIDVRAAFDWRDGKIELGAQKLSRFEINIERSGFWSWVEYLGFQRTRPFMAGETRIGPLAQSGRVVIMMAMLYSPARIGMGGIVGEAYRFSASA